MKVNLGECNVGQSWCARKATTVLCSYAHITPRRQHHHQLCLPQHQHHPSPHRQHLTQVQYHPHQVQMIKSSTKYLKRMQILTKLKLI